MSSSGSLSIRREVTGQPKAFSPGELFPRYRNLRLVVPPLFNERFTHCIYHRQDVDVWYDDACTGNTSASERCI